MGLNKYVGWGLSSLALMFLNKNSNSSDSSSSTDPSDLNVTQTKLGTPIPAGLGRLMIKSPLIAYYGDFSSRAYTETYAAHANFAAWPMVFSAIAQVLVAPATGLTNPGQPVTTNTGGGVTSGPGTNKDNLITPLIQMLFMWLLSWLINGRNLKTTIQKGFKYYLGWQQILCWTHPNARLKRIYMNEYLVWEGDEPASNHLDGSPFVISIDNENLFGGADENGGFVGEIHVYFGGENQGADAWMVQQMSVDSVQKELRGFTPAYRPFISVVVPTAYVGKSATIPTMWFEVDVVPDTLKLGAIGDDANPSEILHELHVNTNWGLAEAADLLNIDSLKEIGKTLANEKIGLSVPITSKTEARTLIDDICEHINAVRYLEPSTGKLTYKLIRDDFDVTKVPLVNTSNCKNIKFTRQDWTNTVSEVSISYTDRNNLYETGSLSDNDPANVEIQKGIKTDKTYSMPYFTNAENALWAAKRELKQEGYPLATVSLECNRQLSRVRLGEVICLNWPPYGIINMYLRVTKVDTGEFVDGTVAIEAIEDVFALAKTTYGFSGSTEWERNPIYPTGVQNLGYLELPFELLRSKDTYVYAFASQPATDTTSWTIWRKRDGASFETTNSMSKWTAAGRLIYDYAEFTDAEDMVGIQIVELCGIEDLKFNLGASSTADIASARKGGKILMMGNELMAYSSLNQLPNGNWTVSGIIRGVYDTVPKAHTSGETIFFLESGHYANVTTGGPVCREGNAVTEYYNITTATIDKKEEFDNVKTKEITTVRRAERPCVQGKIRMNAHMIYDSVHADKIAGDLKLTWFGRNKLIALGCSSQDDEKEYYTGQDFTPPDNLEYVTEVYVNDVCIRQHVSTDTFFDYTWAQRCIDSTNLVADTVIKTYCRVGDLSSFRAQSRMFSWEIPILVNSFKTELAASNCIDSWDNGGQIVVPAGTLNDAMYIDYNDLPVIVLGNKVPTLQANAIRNQLDEYIVPNGKMAVFRAKDDCVVIDIDTGFTIMTEFTDDTEAVRKYLQWNGMQFDEIKIE